MELRNNNSVKIAGKIAKELEFSHKTKNESFYETEILSRRESGTLDAIPVLVSEYLVDVSEVTAGEYVEIDGSYRSFNAKELDKVKVRLEVFAQKIEFLNKKADENIIEFDGYICKKPLYRETPLGRKITDLCIAVNRGYGKCDYIPCICWGRFARCAERLDVGTHLKLVGRIQSRTYEKKISETEVEKRVAYEVSIRELEVM